MVSIYFAAVVVAEFYLFAKDPVSIFSNVVKAAARSQDDVYFAHYHPSLK